MTENGRNYDLSTQWEILVDDSDVSDGETLEEHSEASEQTRPLSYTSQEIMVQSDLFSTLSFPFLDYLYIDLESLISLESVNNSIRKGQFPNLKVLDIAGLRGPDSCSFGMDKRRILEGFELLVVTCKEKGIMPASEGKPIEGFGDLWWHSTAKPAREVEDED